MGLRTFLQSAGRLLRQAKKPAWNELWLSIKICILGILVIGAIGFIIKLLSSLMLT
ncbi:MAG: protein translocase SEC61 complex subunit gamma [Candidatus Bathyarchaeota archaeon]|nr:MAG: protein translocase SEC61 complex subunit gamma [Candidatus Bathyarchaeota archaeon]UCD40203.1 MAG: protein translocase SEC61 complex subunit gamma [Candidatus Bathyarchaeota archaeon]UCD40535.1 MAG: protein translocase SEC61 complex subunit gamma [Candidatus Bathyarchaeota archaeon]